jgi:putative FmdB family regulatory protein
MCQTCSHRFEVKQSIKDAPLTSCVRCGREVSKLISSPAIMFKGSGWYVTDYSDKLKPTSSNDGAEKPADKPAEGKDAQPASTSGEKPAAATPAPSKEATAAPARASSASSATTPTPTASS